MSNKHYEYAAKACGYDLSWPVHGIYEREYPSVNGSLWNPTEVDAQAFRAMVDAEVEVCFLSDEIKAEKWDEAGQEVRYYISCPEDYPNKHSATRKAIFECLVAIGKSMEE